jgi:hypothetical protein
LKRANTGIALRVVVATHDGAQVGLVVVVVVVVVVAVVVVDVSVRSIKKKNNYSRIFENNFAYVEASKTHETRKEETFDLQYALLMQSAEFKLWSIFIFIRFEMLVK